MRIHKNLMSVNTLLTLKLILLLSKKTEPLNLKNVSKYQKTMSYSLSFMLKRQDSLLRKILNSLEASQVPEIR